MTTIVLAQDPDCPDCCIISAPVPPKTGLGISVEVTEGRNLIRTRVGYFNNIYASESMGEAGLTLVPGDSYTVKNVGAIIINTDLAVNVTLTANGISVTLQVQKMLMLDGGYDQVVIENPVVVVQPGNPTNARVFVAYTNT